MTLPIKEITSRVWELEERPQFEIPPFPWEELEEVFSSRFPGKKISIRHENKGWLEGDPWVSNFKAKEIFPIYVEPVEDPLFFAISKEDLNKSLNALIDKEEVSFYFSEKPIYEAFTYFFVLEILNLVSKLKFSEYLSFRIDDDKEIAHKSLKKDPFFAINVSLTIDQNAIFGTLIIPESFRIGWKKHFLHKYGPQFSPSLQKRLDLDLSCEIGYVDLLLRDLKKVEQGDWIMLDHCSYNPFEKEGFGVLTMGDQPIFRAHLKKDELKVLEYPHLPRGDAVMDKDNEFEEFDIDEPLETEEEFYEEDEIEEVEEEEEEKEVRAEEKKEEPSLLAKIPVRIVIEISRLRMSLEELGKLQVGSVFELPTSYEEGVNLLVNGKVIGKGELVKIGEKMGVRIIEL